MSKALNRDQSFKIKLLVALKNIINSCDTELFERIADLLQMIQKFVIDPDDSIIAKAKECDEMLKAKILQISTTQNETLQVLLNLALSAIREHFENENLNVKNWCLGWLSFFLNIDMHMHKQYGKIVISLIQFLHESKNGDITMVAKRLLDQALSKFASSSLFNDLGFSVDFLDKQLALYVSLMKRDTEQSNEKCEIILNWSILIANQLRNMFTEKSGAEGRMSRSELGAFETSNAKAIENIFQNSIHMITTYSKHKKQSIKEKLGQFNEIITSLFQSMNALIDETQAEKASRYKQILEFSLLEMATADDQTVDLLLQWNEQIFQAIRENYVDHIEHMIKVLDNKNERVNNNVIRFISSVIHQLNNPALTKKIFCYFLETNKQDSSMTGFLKFLKILFNQFPSLPLFLSLLSEVTALNDAALFPKVVQSFHLFLIFEEHFAFLRDLLAKVKSGQAGEEELNAFKDIVVFWCHDKISLFSLSIMSGKYKLAYDVINDFTKTAFGERQLLQLTMVVKMLELPYLSQVRIDLLDYEK